MRVICGLFRETSDDPAAKPYDEQAAKQSTEPAAGRSAEPAVKVSNLWFRYDKKSQDVLRDLNLTVDKGQLFCVLGGNGVGKSTTLKVISHILKQQRGKVTVNGTLAMLPQNPQALFTEISVEDEMMEALHDSKEPDEVKVQKALDMLATMEISHLRKSHPYDLSGGEQQRLALGYCRQQRGKIIDSVNVILFNSISYLLSISNINHFLWTRFCQFPFRLSSWNISSYYGTIAINTSQLHSEFRANLPC